MWRSGAWLTRIAAGSVAVSSTAPQARHTRAVTVLECSSSTARRRPVTPEKWASANSMPLQRMHAVGWDMDSSRARGGPTFSGCPAATACGIAGYRSPSDRVTGLAAELVPDQPQEVVVPVHHALLQ